MCVWWKLRQEQVLFWQKTLASISCLDMISLGRNGCLYLGYSYYFLLICLRLEASLIHPHSPGWRQRTADPQLENDHAFPNHVQGETSTLLSEVIRTWVFLENLFIHSEDGWRILPVPCALGAVAHHLGISSIGHGSGIGLCTQQT